MVDSTKITRKVSFHKRPAEVEMLRQFSMTKCNGLAPFKAQLRLRRELDNILTVQNSDEDALQLLRRIEKEESERPIEKEAKAPMKRREEETESPAEQEDEVQSKRRREEQEEKPIEKSVMTLNKRRREEETECPTEQADEVQRKRGREEESEKPVEKRVMTLKKRRREEETKCPTEQADEVQRKRRREEESEKPVEKKVMALKKRRKEEKTECPTEQADEVQRKRRREEESEKPVEKRVMALKKRREEKTECPTKQADEVQRKRREEESEKPIEMRVMTLKKRRREEETECPTEQADEIQRKRRREEESEKPVEKRVMTLKKRRREEKTECPTEQADEVQRKRIREEESEKPIEKRAKALGKGREEESERTAKAPRKRTREKEAENPVEKRHTVSGEREERTEHPAAKLDKTAQNKGEEEKIERRKQELIEILSKMDREEKRSREEEERMEEKTRVPGRLYLESFSYHKLLGSGSHGKVKLATHRDSGKLVAVKIVEKTSLIAHDRDTIMNERKIMQMLMGHPYCTQLYATFQSEDHLFYVMEFLSGGDLRKQIEAKKSCDLPTMRRLAAELLCAVQFVHSKGVLHGDLNPDNILLDCKGHVKLADFGIAETNMFGSKTITEEFGTELYMAPEIFKEEPFDKAVDFFALGVTLFEAAFGIYPFNANDPKSSICYETPRYPIGADDVLVDFLNKLLCKDQKKRKVYIANIRKHRFFRGINWEQLEAGETRAPFSACRKNLEEMTKTTIDLYTRLVFSDLEKTAQALFMGFSFVSEEWEAIQNLKTKEDKRRS